MSAAALFAAPPPRLCLGPGIVEPAQWARLEEIDRLLEGLRRLQADVDARLERAEAEARARGLERAEAELAERLARELGELNRRRSAWLADSEAQLVELACTILQHLLPRLDARMLIPALAREAVAAAQAEQFLLVRVPAGGRALLEAELAGFRQLHPGVAAVDVVEDEGLPTRACVVVSEAGEVRADLDERLEAVRRALLTPPSEASP